MRSKGKISSILLLLIIFIIVGFIFNKFYSMISLRNSKGNPISIGSYTKDSSDVNIVAQAGLTYDVDDNKIIYEKNIHSKMYPASTTKLLTAQVCEDNIKNGFVNYTRDAKIQPPNKLDLAVNTNLSLNDALEGMLIFSANDIAVAVAESSSSSEETFVEKMNEKAHNLGANESNFVNPNGLHDDNHYTTAYDLCKIAKNVYKYPTIMKVLGTKYSTINVNGRTIPLENTNKLLSVNGCIGGKTGYTSKAGKCLVTYYERNGKRMIGIVMASATDKTVFDDMEKIIDWSYNK